MKNLFTTSLLILFVFVGFAQKPDMVTVAGGEFTMGNNYSSEADEKPEHQVTLDDFLIGSKEVTFEEFDLFCAQTRYPKPDDGGFGRGKLPVMNVSWMGAVSYCNWLSKKFRLDPYYVLEADTSGTLSFKGINTDANGYRLPTEAEWEYVATGGAETQGFSYAGSNNLDEAAWYAENSDDKPHEVGTKKANELEIYDLNGNAWEWVFDGYSPSYYGKSPESNPTGPDNAENRVYRGGNFSSEKDFVSTTRRFSLSPITTKGMVGFRLAQNKQ